MAVIRMSTAADACVCEKGQRVRPLGAAGATCAAEAEACRPEGERSFGGTADGEACDEGAPERGAASAGF